MASLFNKRSYGQRKRRAREAFVKGVAEEGPGCLKSVIYLIFRVTFFYLFIPYRAFFNNSISKNSKLVYRILTFLLYSFFSYILVTDIEREEGDEVAFYILLAFFTIIAIMPIILFFKERKKPIIDSNPSDETLNIKVVAEIDEISEGNFVVKITESSFPLNEYSLSKVKEKYTEQLRNDGEVVNSLEVKYDGNKRQRKRTITQDVKDRVWNRDGGKCVECGSNENLEFDHIIPFSKGGANTYRNIQLLCENCNRTKSDKIG